MFWRMPSAACGLPRARSLFHHRDGECDARRLDRLEIDGREQPWLRRVALFGWRIGENVRKRADAPRGGGLLGSQQGLARRTVSRILSEAFRHIEDTVGADCDYRRPLDVRTCTRPASVPAQPSAGSVSAGLSVTIAAMSRFPGRRSSNGGSKSAVSFCDFVTIYPRLRPVGRRSTGLRRFMSKANKFPAR